MNKQIRLIPALAFGMALLSISTLANAAVILNVSNATLVAKGAGVDMSVQVTCTSGFVSQLFGNGLLTQRIGNSITSASFSLNGIANCDGNPQNFDVVPVVVSPGKPFKHGVAFLSLNVSVFNDVIPGVDSGVLQKEITLTK
jgi:hypothetical protein